jgi:dTDP-4-dehydrorhamnose reductase
MRALVLGANGLLGSNVVADALARGWPVAGTYHTDEPALDADLFAFDLGETAQFPAILDRTDPEVVLNCAAMTDVDGCEDHPEYAHEINAAAPGELAAEAAERGVGFVHVSTDYVFDGTAETPYTEATETNPLQVYGESKLAGEGAVELAHDAALLARLSFVYGVHRSTGALTGFPAWVYDRLTAGEEVPLFTDQRITPTRAGQAATTLLDLVVAGERGLFNVASRSCVTPCDLGRVLARRLDAPADLLVESSLESVDRPAPRPRYTCLSTERVARVLGRDQPALEADIEAALSDNAGGRPGR